MEVNFVVRLHRWMDPEELVVVFAAASIVLAVLGFVKS